MIIGHLALAVLIARYDKKTDALPLAAGSILPDVGDKALKLLFHKKEGRTFFHSLLGFSAFLAVVYAFDRAGWRRSWAIGYAAHLLADLGGDIPWFYPLIEYEYRYYPYSYGQKVVRLLTHPRPMESFLTIWALIELVRWRKTGRLKKTTTPGPDPGGTPARS